MSETGQTKCNICKVHAGKYVCPKCNSLYCGLECYRSQAHAHCSEQFYKDCIQEEMQLGTSQEESRSMQEILARLYEGQALEEAEAEGEEEEDDDFEADSDDSASINEEDLASRLEGVNLDDADQVWQKLSKEEQADFHRLIAAGDTSQILPEWEPWWNYKAAAVQEVENADNYKKNCPEIKNDIPALKDISKVSPAVRFGMSNVILSYVLMARYFRGDHLDPEICHEAAVTLMELSSNIGKSQNFVDQESAIAAVKLVAPEVVGVSPEEFTLGEEDLLKVSQGPSTDEQFYYELTALSDCVSVLTSALKKGAASSKGEFSKKFQSSSEVDKKWSKKEFTLAIKKLEFYIAYVKKYNNL